MNPVFFWRRVTTKRHFLLTLGILSHGVYLLAQVKNPLPIERISITQGLPSRTIRSLLQDRYGFMWLATEDGLSRYDGYQFKVFKHRRGDSTSLSRNAVGRLLEDKSGAFWVASEDGFHRLNRATDTWKQFRVQPKKPEHPANVVFRLFEDRQRNFWVLTAGGVYLFDRSSEKFTPVSGLECGCINSLYQDRSGVIWGTAFGWDAKMGGLYRIEPGSRRIRHFTHNPDNPQSLGHNWTLQVQEDADGDLWVFSHFAGLSRMTDRQKGVFEHHMPMQPGLKRLEKDTLNQVLMTRDGTIWYGGDSSRVYRFDKRNRRFRQYHHDTPQAISRLSNYQVTHLYEDRRGRIWIGTWGNGLKVLDPNTGKYEQFVNDENDARSLSENLVMPMGLYEDRAGSIWMILQNALNRIDNWAKPFRQYTHNPANPASLGNDRIQHLAAAPDGTVWVATMKGLNGFNPATQTFTRYENNPADPKSLGNNVIRTLYVDSLGGVWAGALLGMDYLPAKQHAFVHYKRHTSAPPGDIRNNTYVIVRDRLGTMWVRTHAFDWSHFDPKTRLFSPLQFDRNDTSSIAGKDVRSLLEDKHGFVWLPSQGSGVHRYDRRTKQFVRFKHDPGNARSLCHDYVHMVLEDRNENLWFATAGGLSQWNRKTGQFTNYTEQDGLPGEHIRGILEDNHGRLWFSTISTITRFDPQTKAFRTYNADDGIGASDFKERVCCKAKDGTLYFGGYGYGLVAFHPDQINDNPRKPEVLITGLSKFNQPVYFDEYLPDKKSVELDYSDNVLSLHYVAINFSQSAKNQYAYQLVGLDKNWVYCGTRREVTYTNLAPGTYTFRVKAANNDGMWNEQGTSLQLVVAPPFYQTWWFLLLAGLTFAGLGYVFYRYRINQVRREEQLKASFDKQLTEVSMTALRAQMNPHFLFNSLNSINHFIIQHKQEEASEYLTKFSRLIRLILSNSSSDSITLDKELETLRLYIELERLRFKNKFDYSINVEEGVDTGYITIPPMLIQPYVENAIWHGLMHKEGEGSLLVQISRDEHFLVCTVQDNGIGRRKAQEMKSKSATATKSMGMQITSERVALLNKLIERNATVEIVDQEDNTGNPIGTTVIIRVPLLD